MEFTPSISRPLSVYLAGEIHTNWRDEIVEQSLSRGMNIAFYTPEPLHEASDECGAVILGAEEKDFWKDHKSAKINAIRIRGGIERSDIVVVKFGEKYKQWNAAFDAGYACALNKKLIVIHPEEFNHALKEVDAAALAVCNENAQAVDILEYVLR
jgi:YtoQ family protein